MTAREHNKLLSIFFFIQAGLTLFGGILVALIYGGMGAFLLTSARRDDGQAVGGFILVLGLAVGLFVILGSAFYAYSGWKLHKEAAIGRTLGIICSCIFLLGFPLGTMLGIYGLWFLLGDEGKAFYTGTRHTLEDYQRAPTPEMWK